MSNFWQKIRILAIISLLTCFLIFNISVITHAQTSASNQLEIQGITGTIEGKKLISPNLQNISPSLDNYLRSIATDIQKQPQFEKHLKNATFPKLDIKIPQSIPTGFLAIADNYWSKHEQTDVNVPTSQYVSGKVTCSGRNVPVAPPAGLAASYLELSDYAGTKGSNYGKRWISGDQMVNGGCGVLKTINGGKEPAGRLVWGTDAFKIVLDSANERSQQAEFSAYMRLCANLPTGRTCSPYFIRLPWFPVQGNNWVVIGGGIP